MANYLREPYSADLDFGTGEWSVGAWVNTLYPDPNLNYLTYSETFNTNWGTTGLTVNTNPGVSSPFVGQTPVQLVQDTSTSQHIVKHTSITTYSGELVLSVYAKADGSSDFISIGVWGYGQSTSPGGFYTGSAVVYQFSTDTFTRQYSWQNEAWRRVTKVQSIPLGNGWYRLVMNFTAGVDSNALYVNPFIAPHDIGGASNNNISGSSSTGVDFAGTAGTGVYVYGFKLNRGQSAGIYTPGQVSLYLPRPGARIASRSFSSGASIDLSIDGYGYLTATANDGVNTPRTVTTTAAYNTGTWTKAEACYTTDGTLSIRVNGQQVAATYGAPLLSLNSRYNLLGYTEQFDSGAWVTYGNTSKSGTSTLTAVYGTGDCQVYQMISAPAAGQYRVSVQARSSANATFTFRFGYTLSTSKSIVGDGTWQTFTHDFTGAGNETFFVLISSNSTIEFRYPELKLTAQAALPYQNPATDLAPLTIGNSYNLDAPFPGSLALLKLSATVPTAEQSQWMYEQEKQMFRAGAQITLPDSNAINDLTYDEVTDKWIAVSSANMSEWSGLVRTNVTAVPSGSYSKLSSASGVTLQARGSNVDITIPSYGLRKELVKRAESAAKLSRSITPFDYVGGFTATTSSTTNPTALTSVAGLTYPTSYIGAQITGTGIQAGTVITAVNGTTIYISKPATATGTAVQISFTDFILPVGREAKVVVSSGSVKQEGSTKDYTRLFDGFKETIRFGVAPGYQTWVQIQATNTTL